MLLVYILIFVILFYGMSFKKKEFNLDGYLSIDSTKSVKGFFLMLVIMSHFTAEFDFTRPIDIYGYNITHFLGQLLVTMFMFYSGYGISESVKRKGTAYVMKMPYNRIFKTWLNFAVATVFFLIADLLLGNEIGIKKAVLSFLAWESLGSNNWYIFTIIALYAMTFISFALIRNKIKPAALLTTVLCVVYIAVMMQVKERWWYDTVICYLLGLWYSIYKQKLEKLFTRNNIIYSVSFIASIAIFIVCKMFSEVVSAEAVGFILHEVYLISFTAGVVLLTLKINFKNKILLWFGDHLFEIYITHKLPLTVIKETGLISTSQPYLFFAVFIVCVLIIAVLFKKLIVLIDSALFKKRGTERKPAVVDNKNQ